MPFILEFQMALPSDSCRRQQLIGHLAKPDHPMAKFMWGNSDTLKLDNDPEGTELNRRVRLFWQEHYTADRMTAVLQSKHSLDQLEEWATTIFRDIPSKKSEPSSFYCFRSLGAPFDGPTFRKLIKIVPVKDVNQVSFKPYVKSIKALNNCNLGILNLGVTLSTGALPYQTTWIPFLVDRT